MATNTTAPAQQISTAPFVRVSELNGEPHVEECVVFIRTFGPWNRGVSAGFVRERAQWLYRHGYARPFNAATDRSALASRKVTK